MIVLDTRVQLEKSLPIRTAPPTPMGFVDLLHDPWVFRTAFGEAVLKAPMHYPYPWVFLGTVFYCGWP
jgi:hypothetical protein